MDLLESPEFGHIFATVSVLLGVGLSLFGYRFFRILLSLIGFSLALLFGFGVVYYFIQDSIIPGVVVGSVLGITSGVFTSLYPSIGIFLFGSFFGFAASVVIISVVNSPYVQEDETRDILFLCFALMGGLLALRARKPVILIGTSAIGSFMVLDGLDHWIGSGFSKIVTSILDAEASDLPFSSWQFDVMGASFLLMSVICTLVQFKVTRGDVMADDMADANLPSCCFRKSNQQKTPDDVPLLAIDSDDELYMV